MSVNEPYREHVFELQGLYGPLQILEGKVQQVWALQELQSGPWQTFNGKGLEVIRPGQWNRTAGPDFKEAIIRLDGTLLAGDVEIHLYREDWWRHGHHLDPAYNSVVLHVVLFSGGIEQEIRTASGKTVEEWTMGPWMREDLEAVSGGEPGLFGELLPELQEWLESDLPENIRERLGIGADRRLQQKESMGRCFFDRYGWEGALHRMTLYYLGFPYNRKSFCELAEAYPQKEWAGLGFPARIRKDWDERIRWGVGRPANQALVRIRQYADLARTGGGWCQRLEAVPEELKEALHRILREGKTSLDTWTFRRGVHLSQWRRWIHDRVLCGNLNAGLSDRLWIDVFLPLLRVRGILGGEECAALWFHGYPGSFPEAYTRLLKLAGIQSDRRMPLCNGWIQGLLWVEDQLRLERVRLALGTSGQIVGAEGPALSRPAKDETEVVPPVCGEQIAGRSGA